MLLLSGIERKQSKLPFESLTMVRFQQENRYKLKIWIAIKQSTNLELNEPVWSGNECERTHTLTTTTTGSKNSQKEANNQTDYQSHNALGPPKVSSLQALGLG